MVGHDFFFKMNFLQHDNFLEHLHMFDWILLVVFGNHSPSEFLESNLSQEVRCNKIESVSALVKIIMIFL